MHFHKKTTPQLLGYIGLQNIKFKSANSYMLVRELHFSRMFWEMVFWSSVYSIYSDIPPLEKVNGKKIDNHEN